MNKENMILFVSPSGNDEWSGRLPEPSRDGCDGPFATLERARDEIRRIKAFGLPQGGVTVLVRGGTYFLEKPFQLLPQDSGTAESPITYMGYKEEQVRLVGGVRVPASMFKPYRDGIYQCDLKPFGLKRFRQLFFNGKRMILARYPNYDPSDPIRGGWLYVAGAVQHDRKRSFRYPGDRPRRWTHPEDCEISIFPNYNWWHTVAEVAKIDVENRVVTLKEELPYTIEPGRRFYFQNVLEELDAPGEWFFDRRTGTLYFYPPEPLSQGEVIVPRLEHVIELKGASHVKLKGFTVECCEGDGIVLENCRECIVAGCTVRNVGGTGIVVRGGEKVRIVSNDVYETGRGGIILSGGDRRTLRPGGHEAVNNHIHHFSRIYRTYQVGVYVEGVGNRVAHNLIHDAPHIAILLRGNDHVIEYNEIHHVCMETADCGGFYMGRDWTERGNVVRYNVFHDIYGYGLLESRPDGTYVYGSPLMAWGVYLDDCASGTLVYGNVFYRIPLCGVMIGGGRDNLVANNVFVGCIPALHIDARWDTYPYDTIMRERLEAVDYRNPPYSERYPALLALDKEDRRRPARNVFVRNIIAYSSDDYRGIVSARPRPGSAVVYDLSPFDGETTVIDCNVVWHYGKPVRVLARFYGQSSGGLTTWEEWRRAGYDKYSMVADPLFTDPGNDDYRLKKESLAFRLGFKQIPLEKIGLYVDSVRVRLPPRDRRKDRGEWREHVIRIQEIKG